MTMRITNLYDYIMSPIDKGSTRQGCYMSVARQMLTMEGASELSSTRLMSIYQRNLRALFHGDGGITPEANSLFIALLLMRDYQVWECTECDHSLHVVPLEAEKACVVKSMNLVSLNDFTHHRTTDVSCITVSLADQPNVKRIIRRYIPLAVSNGESMESLIETISCHLRAFFDNEYLEYDERDIIENA